MCSCIFMEVMQVLNLPLLKRTIKTNGKLWLLCTGLLMLQIFLSLGLYSWGNGMGRIFRGMPQGLAAVLGIDTAADTLTAYLSSCLFGFFYPVLGMVYAITAANRLMAKKVESGTMVYLLSSPNKRGRIANTQAYFLVMSLFAMFFCTMTAGILGCVLRFPGKLDVPQFILFHIGVFCLELCLGGISFLVSCVSNESRISLTIGAGIPVCFLLIHMIANMGGSLEILRFATVFTLFDTADVMGESLSVCWKFPVLAVLGFVFFRMGISLFGKRDLPL